MHFSLRLLILVLSFSFSSCNSKKNTTETILEEKKTTLVNTDELKMKESGYVKAVIKDFSKNEGCGLLIVLTETEQILQTLKPLDIDFQKDGLKIWLKYRPIRPIAPTCKKGTPIDIEDIKTL